MKKEFKAPIIETKELFTQNSIMAELEILTISAGQTARNGFAMSDETVASGFDAWKGNN